MPQVELATDENFSEAGYLEANADVKSADVPARIHFECYGRQEGRMQFAGPPSPRPAMRVSVLGNCQAPVVASCLRAMIPGIEVHGVHLGVASTAPASVSDLVLLQTEFSPLKDDRRHIPERVVERVRLWPTFFYSAFHPDLVYARAGSEALKSPLHEYNSALVLYGWMNRLTVAQTTALFCEAVFDSLGYLDYAPSADGHFIADCEKAGLDGAALLARMRGNVPFCHSVNHPHLAALARITEQVLDAAGIGAPIRGVEKFLADPLLSAQVWPVYPAVADRLGLTGDYLFKASGMPGRILDLEAFVAESFAMYDAHAPSDVTADRLVAQAERYRNVEAHARRSGTRADHPYAKLPDHRFWRKAMAGIAPSDLDPVTAPKFRLSPQDRISAAGSCFAQHIARTLIAEGFNYFVTEGDPANPGTGARPAGAGAGSAGRASKGRLGDTTRPEGIGRGSGDAPTGLFSARFGNIYGARQLLQLAHRAYGRFEPQDAAWLRPDGRYVDPFRPQIEPAGHASEREVVEALPGHFAAVREMFERSDLFIFTVGLTETWESAIDGAVFPVAPGVIARPRDPSRYRFSNATCAEVKNDLESFIAFVRRVNPDLKILLTVSPVPLVATYEDQNVLLATTYSKSVLRAAVGEVCRAHAGVDYFPSYEIVTNWYNGGRYFEPDLRSIAPSGVEHVMRVFGRHYMQGGRPGLGQDPSLTSEFARSSKILCDEEALDATA